MKTLVIDIENYAPVVERWEMYGDRPVMPSQVIEPGGMLCFSAKWLGERRILFASLYEHGRADMAGMAYDLLDQADCVMTYNGKRHDIPKLNTEMALVGLTPPSPFKQIDLFQTIRSQFRLEFKSLDYACKAFNLPGKVSHSGDLFSRCKAMNDPNAWREIEKYNKQDIRALEGLYYRVQPWVVNHPNVGAYCDGRVCPQCGSEVLERRGYAYTAFGQFQRWHCMDCGRWSRDTKRVSAAQLVAA